MARPVKLFAGFVGQPGVVRTLTELATRSMQRRTPVPHLALIGAAGTGKTELARSLAAFLGNFSATSRPTNLHTIHAGPGCLMQMHDALVSAKPMDLIFVDEAHALSAPDAEILYLAIDRDETLAVKEDGRLDRGQFEPIAKVTVVAATNRPGSLPSAFRSRILELELGPYSMRDLRVIAERVGVDNKLQLTPQAARVVAERSNGTPRHVEQIIRLVASIHEGRVTQGELEAALEAHLGLDALGLSPHQRRVLVLLARAPDGALRAEQLVHQVGLDAFYVRTELEGRLQRRGLISVTGDHVRRITDAGRKAVAGHLADLEAVDDEERAASEEVAT